ncbi:hypothetical protein GCU56_18850 [Geodermatophilus sabuli]|uniref:Uncharacterized protein n=1 Tax=Geodermatophilus sabuli TaxID=1564158 RepID=A0A7K3W5E4_9ACTN|nr:hypothetical protein [Geodermatophilus sabuli]NEK59918.1 hypothetical protein [Geodermatophilus sabuli]
MTSFGVGALVPPIASLFGATGTVMGTTMLAMSALSLVLLLTVVRPWRRPEPLVGVPAGRPALAQPGAEAPR